MNICTVRSCLRRGIACIARGVDVGVDIRAGVDDCIGCRTSRDGVECLIIVMIVIIVTASMIVIDVVDDHVAIDVCVEGLVVELVVIEDGCGR